MKIKNYLVAGLVAFGAIFTGCTKDELGGDAGGDGEGAISVRVIGSASGRAVTSEIEESKIEDYKVYVFAWGSGKLEADKKVAGSDIGKTVLFEGLSTASAKRVVVLANLGGEYPDVNNYSELSDDAYKINLDDQHANGVKTYVMSGQSPAPVQLQEGINTVETISLKRAVAKITIGSITFKPDENSDISKLTIKGFSAQRVTPDVTLAPITGYYETEGPGAYHYGGFESTPGGQMQLRDYLSDTDFTLKTDEAGNYKVNEVNTFTNHFLVFPNQSEKNCTLFTIKAEYDGETIYYPIKINDTAVEENGDNTNGRFIESNNHYTLHLTLVNISDGTTDPEIPAGNANLEVVVEVEEWALIVQSQTW